MCEVYRGIVVQESLDTKDILDDLDQIKTKTVMGKWHLVELYATKAQMKEVGKHLMDHWYMHFWKDTHVIAVFAGNKVFEFDYNDKKTWKNVMQYNDFMELSLTDQDFPIKGL